MALSNAGKSVTMETPATTMDAPPRASVSAVVTVCSNLAKRVMEAGVAPQLASCVPLDLNRTAPIADCRRLGAHVGLCLTLSRHDVLRHALRVT